MQADPVTVVITYQAQGGQGTGPPDITFWEVIEDVSRAERPR